MPVGIDQWRAGIEHSNSRFQLIALPRVSLVDLLPSVCFVFIYVYLIIGASVFVLRCSVLTAAVLNAVISANHRWCDPLLIHSQISGHGLSAAYSILYIIICFLKFHRKCSFNPASIRKQILWKAKLLLSGLLCLEVLPYFYLVLLILLSGDIEVNPGPNRNGFLKFCHWNLNSICAREQIKISLIEAYNSIHRYDIFAISETMLVDTVHNDDILIEGFSREIFRSDHADNLRSGTVCIYYRDGLSIK